MRIAIKSRQIWPRRPARNDMLDSLGTAGVSAMYSFVTLRAETGRRERLGCAAGLPFAGRCQQSSGEWHA
jgi:hypothetical protein